MLKASVACIVILVFLLRKNGAFFVVNPLIQPKSVRLPEGTRILIKKNTGRNIASDEMPTNQPKAKAKARQR